MDEAYLESNFMDFTQVFWVLFQVHFDNLNYFITDFVVKINTAKNYIDRIQINVYLVLFYNIIYKCEIQDYTYLS